MFGLFVMGSSGSLLGEGLGRKGGGCRPIQVSNWKDSVKRGVGYCVQTRYSQNLINTISENANGVVRGDDEEFLPPGEEVLMVMASL